MDRWQLPAEYLRVWENLEEPFREMSAQAKEHSTQDTLDKHTKVLADAHAVYFQ